MKLVWGVRWDVSGEGLEWSSTRAKGSRRPLSKFLFRVALLIWISLVY